jgi:DNA-binding NarL/FixJ family response regulator
MTPARLLADGLRLCLQPRSQMVVLDTACTLEGLRQVLALHEADIALIDVMQGVNLEEVRMTACAHPGVALVALGLQEQRQEVIRCGRAGFKGYVALDASVDALCQALDDVMLERLSCSAEISGGLLRALFRPDHPPAAPAGLDEGLTPREGEVLQLIGRGLSNKEIARELALSLGTVKHHVHKVLEKLRVGRRAQAMRQVREAPWIGVTTTFNNQAQQRPEPTR